MKITFISNYLSHHQIPFSDEMYRLIGDKYTFISTIPMEVERVKMGWEIKDEYPYEFRMYESKNKRIEAIKIINESDVVVIGSASDKLIIERLKRGKLTFKYAERFYKKGINVKNIARILLGNYIHHKRFQKYPLYMLCASAYTAADASLFNNYINRTFKWGYYPEFIEYEDVVKVKSKDSIKILWCGRFIDWKHPEKAVIVAKYLKDKGYNYKMNIIGTGPLKSDLIKLVKQKEVQDRVEIIDAKNPNEIRNEMEKSNIYLFTSDYQEGWGAVLNEAMNSGCAVVVSHAIGAVPFLIKDKVNGLIYLNEDINDLCIKVEKLMKDNKLREIIGNNAYLTIKEEWNPKRAAENFIRLCLDKIDNKESYIEAGPCGRAYIIKNDWYGGKK